MGRILKDYKPGSLSWRLEVQRGSWDFKDWICPGQQTLFCKWEGVLCLEDARSTADDPQASEGLHALKYS